MFLFLGLVDTKGGCCYSVYFAVPRSVVSECGNSIDFEDVMTKLGPILGLLFGAHGIAMLAICITYDDFQFDTWAKTGAN